MKAASIPEWRLQEPNTFRVLCPRSAPIGLERFWLSLGIWSADLHQWWHSAPPEHLLSVFLGPLRGKQTPENDKWDSTKAQADSHEAITKDKPTAEEMHVRLHWSWASSSERPAFSIRACCHACALYLLLLCLWDQFLQGQTVNPHTNLLDMAKFSSVEVPISCIPTNKAWVWLVLPSFPSGAAFTLFDTNPADRKRQTLALLALLPFRPLFQSKSNEEKKTTPNILIQKTQFQ